MSDLTPKWKRGVRKRLSFLLPSVLHAIILEYSIAYGYFLIQKLENEDKPFDYDLDWILDAHFNLSEALWSLSSKPKTRGYVFHIIRYPLDFPLFRINGPFPKKPTFVTYSLSTSFDPRSAEGVLGKNPKFSRQLCSFSKVRKKRTLVPPPMKKENRETAQKHFYWLQFRSNLFAENVELENRGFPILLSFDEKVIHRAYLNVRESLPWNLYGGTWVTAMWTKNEGSMDIKFTRFPKRIETLK